MNNILKRWSPILSCAFLTFLLLATFLRNTHVQEYRNSSIMYSVIVTMDQRTSLRELDQLTYSVEQETYQKVYNEVIDSHNRVYKMRVRIPPSDIEKLRELLKRDPSIRSFAITNE